MDRWIRMLTPEGDSCLVDKEAVQARLRIGWELDETAEEPAEESVDEPEYDAELDDLV